MLDISYEWKHKAHGILHLLLLNIFSKFIHIVAQISTFSLLLNYMPCLERTHFIHPFISCQAFRLFSFFFWQEQCYYEQSGVRFSFFNIYLASSGLIASSGVFCGIVGSQFPDQGLNPHLLHCKANSQPLDHQGSSSCVSFCMNIFFLSFFHLSFLLFILVMLCGLPGSQFSNQGLNSSNAMKAWNPNHQATRELLTSTVISLGYMHLGVHWLGYMVTLCLTI